MNHLTRLCPIFTHHALKAFQRSSCVLYELVQEYLMQHTNIAVLHLRLAVGLLGEANAKHEIRHLHQLPVQCPRFFSQKRQCKVELIGICCRSVDRLAFCTPATAGSSAAARQ
eukprot:1854908-Amphidinium_carterae.1